MGNNFGETDLFDIVAYGFSGTFTAILLDDSRAELLFHSLILAVGAWALEFVWKSYGGGNGDD